MTSFQFGNLAVILLEPGNITRMKSGKAFNFPIKDITRNILIAYTGDTQRFLDEYKKRNIGTVVELGKLIMEAREWKEVLR